MRAIASEISKLSAVQRAELASRLEVVTIEGRALSLFNQCMIARQLTSATVVGGFRQWIAAGRTVRKGEHGAAIWIPTHDKRADFSARSLTCLGTVFDVSQTEAKPARHNPLEAMAIAA